MPDNPEGIDTIQILMDRVAGAQTGIATSLRWLYRDLGERSLGAAVMAIRYADADVRELQEIVIRAEVLGLRDLADGIRKTHLAEAREQVRAADDALRETLGLARLALLEQEGRTP